MWHSFLRPEHWGLQDIALEQNRTQEVIDNIMPTYITRQIRTMEEKTLQSDVYTHAREHHDGDTATIVSTLSSPSFCECVG